MIDVGDLLQAGQAFLEGVALIASPCILPVLPIILAGSLDGGRRRPFGIITGFVASFVGFALLSRQLLIILHADPVVVRDVALVLLAFLGIIMFSKKLSDKLFSVTQGLANLGQNLTSRWDQKQGYLSGVAIGMLVGLIWSPCAGPIMAAAIVQIIQAKSGFAVAVTVGMFAIGAGVPMLLIALMGRQVMARMGFLKTHSNAVRRVLGVVILLSAVLIYEGADVKLLAAAGESSSKPNEAYQGNKVLMALDNPYPAPEFAETTDWLNSAPLKMADLRGKVVLVDFWTYSCINCVRTLPHLTDWDAKYRDKGLVIIGVHSPEFEFEKKRENVADAIKRFGIQYPVVLDNNLATWKNFNNHYWPQHYLINKDGQVVYTHFGEGEYDLTENNIRALLGLGQAEAAPAADNFSIYTPTQSRETYLGYKRAANNANKDGLNRDEIEKYVFPETLPLHHWALAGEWNIDSQNITTEKPKAALRFNFSAKKVFLVMGTATGKPVHVHVLLNGQPIGAAGGVDVKDGLLTVDSERLYELINQDAAKDGLLELQFDDEGTQAYAFTFG